MSKLKLVEDNPIGEPWSLKAEDVAEYLGLSREDVYRIPPEKSGARFVGCSVLYVAGCALILALFALAWCSDAEGQSVTEDAAWIAGGAVLYEAGANALNLTEWHVGRTYGWPDPFQSPTNDYGCLPLCAGEESHYVTWAALGAGMSLRGHPWWQAWLLSGVWANAVWEFGVETTYTEPSGHDVVINAASALVGVGVVELVRWAL